MSNWLIKKLGTIFNSLFLYKIKSNYVGIFGLIISSLGAFISAISFTASDGRVVSPLTGFEYHIAIISNYGFKIGLYLLILGFFFQILEKVSFKKENIKLGFVILVFIGSVALYVWTIRLFSTFLFL